VPERIVPDVVVYLGLGSNRGDRRAFLCGAIRALASRGVEPLRVSPLYDTDYVGPLAPQDPYLNAVLEARTALAPEALLDLVHQVEREAGREPDTHQRPRTLDLDLLLYGDLRLDTPRLTVPHPRLAERRFVLEPLRDLGVLRDHPEWERRRRELETTQGLRPAGALAVEEWRGETTR
jgi:2-amino-4-hydroxy-6-hydroxymethyldihydropteridine diphosphokinase